MDSAANVLFHIGNKNMYQSRVINKMIIALTPPDKLNMEKSMDMSFLSHTLSQRFQLAP